MSEKSRIFIEDFILIIVSIVGVGFSGGAESKHFFCSPIFPILVIIFLILFVTFFNIIYKFKTKNKIFSFYQLNTTLFPKLKIINKLFVLFYLVLSASMLAGTDELMNDVLGLNLPIASLVMCIFVYIIILKGVDGIKKIFSKFVPIILLIIFINLFVNSFYLSSGFQNFYNLFELEKIFSVNNIRKLIMPFLFFGSNFVLAINSIINLRGNSKKISIFSTILFGVFLSLSCVVVMLNKNSGVMPLFDASKNLSDVFFWLYFVALIFSIFSTLSVSTWNEYQLCNFDSNYSLIIILIINMIISLLGFKFIIKYLYTFRGVVGIIYCLALAIKIKIFNKNQK